MDLAFQVQRLAPGAARLFTSLRGQWTIRQRLALTVLAAVVPLNVLLIVTIVNITKASREAQVAGLRYTTQSVVVALDAHLKHYIAIAEILAKSPSLLKDDLTAFRNEAERAFPDTSEAAVIVSDPQGGQLLNLLVPPGAPLPHRSDTGVATQVRAFSTKSLVISDVFLGRVRNSWVTDLEVPLFRNGQPFRSLTVTLATTSFYKLLSAQKIPSGWLAGIIDTTGHFLARIPANDAYIGQLASESWREVMHREGVFEFRTLEGDRTVGANLISSVSGWPVALSARTTVLNAPTWDTTKWAVVGTIAISLMSLLLTLAIARRISVPIVELEKKAPALLAGQPAHFHSDLPEIDRTWAALKEAVAKRTQAELDLRVSEEQLRSAAEGAQFGTYDYDVLADCVSWSPQLKRILGTENIAEPIRLETAIAFLYPKDRERVEALMSAILAGEQRRYEMEFRVVRSDGQVRWVMDRGQATVAGIRVSRIAGILMDITERKQAEERQQLLHRELAHRSKNLLAVVQAVARHMAQSTTSPEQFADEFGSRLRALAMAQDLLTNSESKGADMCELVRHQLTPFLPESAAGRLTIDGPAVLLPPAIVTSLSMVLHELATNASKHGALSTPRGTIHLNWTLSGEDKDRLLHLTWSESGGPPVSSPARKGFGSILLGTSSGRFEPRYLLTGFQCEIDFELTPATS